jgi:hypothetical protein
VIERHDDHDDAANDIDRLKAGTFYRDGFGHGGHWRVVYQDTCVVPI